MQKNTFHEDLRQKIDAYVHFVYALTRSFPKEELYGVVSQLRRATLSVALNYIEGYARIRALVHKNFLEIAYGSLKESAYILDFSLVEKYISVENHRHASLLANDIGAMLWGMIKKLSN